jgi:serpin B
MPSPDRRTFLTASAALLGTAGLRPPFARAAEPKPADWAPVVAGNTAFGLDLYGQLRSEAGNLFLSPFSISTALAMTSSGAKGTTLDEMTKVLHLPADPHAGFGALLRSLNEEPDPRKRGFTLVTANALSAQAGYPWRPEFKRLVAEAYGAGLFDMDFKGNPEAARGAINNWVAKETRDKIQNLLPAGSVTTLTRTVLTNAIYFKGDWEAQFKKEATKEAPFTRADGTKVDVPLMFRAGGYNYAENDAFQVLDLPYVGRRVSMTVILPRKADGLPAVEKELTGDKLAAALGGLRYEPQVHVHLPRFKVEAGFNLNAPLKALGMKAAFGGAADFTGMHTGKEHLYISDVFHKAFVDVNEEGTEAAAATAVVVGNAPSPAPPPPKVFRADHPFLFLIRDTKTGSVLFLGRLENPKG